MKGVDCKNVCSSAVHSERVYVVEVVTVFGLTFRRPWRCCECCFCDCCISFDCGVGYHGVL